MMYRFALIMGAIGVASAAQAQVGPETVADGSNPQVGVEKTDIIIQVSCSDTLAYDSGNPFAYGTGRTIGTPSHWAAYQPFALDSDWQICGFDLDGWYVNGSPRGFQVQFYPDDGSGDMPDLSQPMLGAPADMQLTSNAQGEDWVSVDIDGTCFEADTLYWLEATTGPNDDHWSAIYRDTPFGMQSYSIRGGDFGTKFRAPSLAMRLRGEEGCGGGGCADACGDIDGDGDSDADDFFAYLDQFSNGDDCADIDGDGDIDADDFFGYLDLFVVPC